METGVFVFFFKVNLVSLNQVLGNTLSVFLEKKKKQNQQTKPKCIPAYSRKTRIIKSLMFLSLWEEAFANNKIC